MRDEGIGSPYRHTGNLATGGRCWSDQEEVEGWGMNTHQQTIKTLRKMNRELRAELKRVIIELKYTQALYKQERRENKR